MPSAPAARWRSSTSASTTSETLAPKRSQMRSAPAIRWCVRRSTAGQALHAQLFTLPSGLSHVEAAVRSAWLTPADSNKASAQAGASSQLPAIGRPAPPSWSSRPLPHSARPSTSAAHNMQQPTGSIWKRSRSRRLRSAAPALFAAAVVEDSGANAEREEAEWRARNVLAIEDDRALARRLEDQGCVVAEAGRDGSPLPSSGSSCCSRPCARTCHACWARAHHVHLRVCRALVPRGRARVPRAADDCPRHGGPVKSDPSVACVGRRSLRLVQNFSR